MEPLKKAKHFKGPQGPVVLAILDGVGIGSGYALGCRYGQQ
jgi:hypothetical protein